LPCRSPPLLRRWRTILPEDASIGFDPRSAPHDFSLRRRFGLSPAAMSSPAAVSGPTPNTAQRAGAMVVVIRRRLASRMTSSSSRSMTRRARPRSASLVMVIRSSRSAGRNAAQTARRRGRFISRRSVRSCSTRAVRAAHRSAPGDALCQTVATGIDLPGLCRSRYRSAHRRTPCQDRADSVRCRLPRTARRCTDSPLEIDGVAGRHFGALKSKTPTYPGPRHRGVRTQNSLPSGSASTTHPSSPAWPTLARVAPSAMIRWTSSR
jgi:hypothetical protein